MRERKSVENQFEKANVNSGAHIIDVAVQAIDWVENRNRKLSFKCGSTIVPRGADRGCSYAEHGATF